MITEIPKQSAKEAERLRKYAKARKEFLSEPGNDRCAVFPTLQATQVHHKKGRIGSLLWDKRFFLPVSGKGHTKIENNPEWAYENGYSLSRLGLDVELPEDDGLHF